MGVHEVTEASGRTYRRYLLSIKEYRLFFICMGFGRFKLIFIGIFTRVASDGMIKFLVLKLKIRAELYPGRCLGAGIQLDELAQEIALFRSVIWL